MNNPEAKGIVVPKGVPTWSEEAQFLKVKRWASILVGVAVVLWLVLIGWVFFIADIHKAQVTPLEVGADLTLVLAPVLVAAAAVERTLETLFNTIEKSWRTFVAYMGRGLRWLKSAETEVQQARQFLADVSGKYNMELMSIQVGEKTVSDLTVSMQTRMDAANTMLGLAHKRLEEAEKNLAELTESSGYVGVKAALSIVIGLMLGVIIAAVGQMQMFALLGIAAVPARFDVFITGLVIGSGSYPVHSLVGILQQGKDVLDSASGYFKRVSPTARKEEKGTPPAA